jgi:hypothetical protein
MDNPQPVSEELERVLRLAKIEFQQVDHTPFSPEAFQRLTERIDGYIGELVTESGRVARRHNSDSISPSYVDEASQHLISRRTAKWHRLIGAIGGTIFGMGLTSIITMTVANNYSIRSVIVSVVALVVGLIALTYHVWRD